MRDKLKLFACMLALGGLTLAGCGDDDDGTTPGTDGGTEDAGGGDAGARELPVATVEGGAAPDWSCVGMRTVPAPGEPVAIMGTFDGSPLMGMVADGTVVEFFPGNAVVACPGEGCVTATATGNDVTVTLPSNGWFGYRVPAGATQVETVSLFRRAPMTAGSMSLTVISSTAAGLVPALFDSHQRAPNTAAVSGAANDCVGRPVQGVELRVWVDGARVNPGGGAMEPYIGYLTPMTMANANPWTTSAGTYLAGNIPVGLTRMELWARTAEGEEPRRVACEEAQNVANGVVVLSVPPLRMDYAEGSGCAM